MKKLNDLIVDLESTIQVISTHQEGAKDPGLALVLQLLPIANGLLKTSLASIADYKKRLGGGK